MLTNFYIELNLLCWAWMSIFFFLCVCVCVSNVLGSIAKVMSFWSFVSISIINITVPQRLFVAVLW